MLAKTNESILVERTVKVIKAAEKRSEMKRENYEVRLLFIPTLHVTALWLMDIEGKADLAMPIEPIPPPLIPNELMPLGDLLAILQEQTKSKLASYHGDDTWRLS